MSYWKFMLLADGEDGEETRGEEKVASTYFHGCSELMSDDIT
jgi:hypothetical protein